ncbi:MAG: sigma 54-interacting transcriptional regulator [Planctomycetes bacterium]|nr:sigma 54-interacting transcriptional regulator [Planctomycetota bacterium]
MSAAPERTTALPSWPHYRCERLLGRGASGSVYLARDAASGEAVAVKRFLPELREQAAREAGILAGVRFPGVVELRDATIDPVDGSFLAVFELIEGQDLFAATARATYQECAALLADVLRALAFVHRRGIVHRDLKPENLLVSRRGGKPSATLIDFGLAAGARHSSFRAAGTLAYLAPEVLAGGAPDRASDLYSAGVVLYQLLTRRLPSEGLAAVDVVRLHLAGDLTLPPEVASRLPRGLVDLVATLLRRDPALRLLSAAEALEALARATQQSLPLETPETLAGRARSMEFPLPEGLAERLAEHGAGTGGIAVTLPVGSAAALRRLRVAWAAAGRVVIHQVLGAGRALPPESARPPAGGCVYLVECAGALNDAEIAYAAGLLAAAADGARRIAVVIACEDDRPLPPWLAGAAPARLELPRPSRGQVMALVREALAIDLSAADLRRLRVANDFTPLSVIDGLCRLIEAAVLCAEGDRPQWDRSRRLERLAAASSVARAAAVVAALAEADRAFLQALSLPGVPLPPALAERMRAEFSTGAAVSSLGDFLERGLVESDSDSGFVSVASEALAVALLAGLPEPELARLRRRAGRLLLEERPEDAEALGEAALLLFAGGAAEDALPLLVDAGVRLRCAGRPGEGRRYLEPALDLSPAASAPAARLRVLRWLADCESLAGRNAEAARLAGEALSLVGAADDLGRCHAILARTLLRRGDLEESGQALAAGLALAGIEPTTRALLLTTRSMLLRARQEHEAAAAVAEEALLAAGGEATLERGAALMTLANAQGFLGRVDEAAAAYRQAEELGRALGREDMTALAVANLGRLLYEDGRMLEAVDLLEPVLDSFERAGSIRHAESMLLTLMPARGALGDIAGVRALGLKGRSFFGEDSAQVNRAMFLRHMADAELCAGNVGEAERLARESVAIRERISTLPHTLAVGLAQLVRVLARQERAPEARAALARALCLERGSSDAPAREETAAAAAEAHLLEGRPGAAVPAARRAARWARRMRAPRQLRRAAALLGLALLRRGDPAGALQQTAEAAALPGAARQDSALGLLLGVRAAALAPLGRGAEAETEFERSLACLGAEGHAYERAQVLLLRARCRLRAAAQARAPGSGREILELASLASQARSDVAQARAICTSLSLGVGLREAAALDSDLDSLESLAGDTRAAQGGLERRIRSMERLVEVNKAINSELDPKRLLNLILDDAIQLCRARRGFLILVQGAKIDVRVARNFAEQDIQHPEFQFSHSVARQVALSGEPIRTSNALHDQRLKSIPSIAELRVVSILCVPLRSGDHLLGSIYLDHPDVVDRFDQGDLELLADFASAAGIALERARLYQENSERAGALAGANREIERLNAELMKTVAAQARELDLAKDVIEAERSAAARRYDYRNIVTQSSSMVEVLRLLDRITETDFPVLIQGESGTGKELVARAIHYNGPRARGNFVSVNCAAVAEPLIEAELFGYMKGAFTGADRDRPGLFEIADGGTLFLDEIGDMSLEVQKRLLRVVQHGEFYRVGGKEPVRVKVRVISATHRNLKELMAAGQFREDLFYRLNVAPVTLPPVRARAGDVPLLVQYFSDELVAAGLAPAKTFTREAMAALQKYSWPGNVREIQNEVRRLMCLKTDRGTIELEDLAAGIVEAARLRGTAAPRSLKALLEEHERAIIAATLEEAGGNKAEAARRLGLTVRGLYKALERLEPPGGVVP